MVVKVKEQSKEELKFARERFISVLTEIILKYEAQNGTNEVKEDNE